MTAEAGGLGGADPSAQEVHAFLDSLTIGGTLPDVALPGQATAAMAVRSLRLPLDLDQRIKTAAQARGVPASTLVREWIELGLTATEDDAPISRADALRALAGLRPLPGSGSAA
jgi:predicted DNA-binding protein